MMKFYDNSRLRSYKTCPRRFYFRHVRHWASTAPRSALSFGVGWHSALDAIWRGEGFNAAVAKWQDVMLEKGFTDDSLFINKDFRTSGTVKEMLKNYIKQYSPYLASIQVISIEQPFAVPLGPTDKVFYVGRLDKIWENNKGHIYFTDHKTTTSYKKDGPFRESFINSFNPDSQIDGYLYAGKLLYPDTFKGVWIDLALVHKTVHDGFRLLPVNKTFESLDLWLWEAIGWVRMINSDLRRLLSSRPEDSYLTAFPRNTEACTSYAGCPYRHICRFHPNPLKIEHVPEGFKYERWQPFEELELAKIGLQPGED